MRTHRAFRQLATALASQGFPVLRFDYFATGDSAGNDQESSVSRWQDDILTAATELKALSGLEQLSLIGLRLGGALATSVADGRLTLKKLILWDAVISGEQYIDELRSAHQQMLKELGRSQTDKHETEELLGFPFSNTLLHEIETINLLQQRHFSAEKVFLLVSATAAALDTALRHKIESAGVNVTQLSIDAAADISSKRYDQQDSLLFSSKAVKTIASLIAQDAQP